MLHELLHCRLLQRFSGSNGGLRTGINVDDHPDAAVRHHAVRMLLHDLFLYAVLRLRHLVPETTISSKSRRSGVQHLPPNGAATSVQSLSPR